MHDYFFLSIHFFYGCAHGFDTDTLYADNMQQNGTVRVICYHLLSSSPFNVEDSFNEFVNGHDKECFVTRRYRRCVPLQCQQKVDT